MDILDFFRSFGGLVSLVISAVLGLGLWALRRSFATTTDHLRLSARVDVHDAKINALPDPAEVSERLARIEERGDATAAALARIEGFLIDRSREGGK